MRMIVTSILDEARSSSAVAGDMTSVVQAIGVLVDADKEIKRRL